MKKILLTAVVAAFGMLASQAYAADAGCEAKAVDKAGKPLVGAAKAASIKKCEKAAGASTANAACEAKAVDKNGKALAGAAKAASIKKCVKEGGPK